MKYLITGATGFLGKSFCEKIDEDNNQIMKIDLRSLYYQDIYEIKEFQPDYIINFAADIYNDGKMFKANVEDVQTLLNITINIPYKKFIQIGSSSEYGYKKFPMSEDDILSPRTMYESTKGMATLLCQGFSNTYSKPITVVRPFSVYGKNEKSHRFIPTLIQKFKEKSSITISEGVHDFIHIDDFIEGLFKILHFENEGFDIVNLGTGNSYSNMAVYELISEIFGYNIEVNKSVEKLRPFDTLTWQADIEKLNSKYNYFPKTTLKKGLIKMING